MNNASARGPARQAVRVGPAPAAASVAASAPVAPIQARLTIARAARAAGVGVETIRFYERKGLIQQPARPAAGYRLYPESTVQRVRFLRHCQQLGFTLKEAAALADNFQCANAARQIATKIAELDRKIAALQALRRQLRNALRRQGVDACGVCETLRA